MVYYTENFNFSQEERDLLFLRMPKERQEKYNKYALDSDKNRCIGAYLLLEYGLKAEFHINTPTNIAYNENNKPVLVDYPRIHFNISHCKTGIACAISQGPIGVDIQDFREFSPKAAKRLCNREEFLKLIRSKNPTAEFTNLWTRFESLYKYYGYQLGNIPDDLLFSQMQTEKFMLTVCSHKTEMFQQVPLEALTHMNV